MEKDKRKIIDGQRWRKEQGEANRSGRPPIMSVWGLGIQEAGDGQ